MVTDDLFSAGMILMVHGEASSKRVKSHAGM